MKTLKITYADGSTEKVKTEKPAEVLFNELFSHLSEENQKKCSVKEVKPKAE